MVFRVAAVMLGVTGFLVFNLGVDLCTSLGNCGDVPVSTRGFLRPHEVQFMMLLTSVAGMMASVVGLVRGPNTLLPAFVRKPLGRIEEEEPLGVRGTMLFGASAVLVGLIIPLHGLATPVRAGQAVFFYSTLLLSVGLVSYFGWHLGTEHHSRRR